MGKEDLKGMELNEMELEDVNGGANINLPTPISKKKADCPECKKETWFYLYSGGRAICKECGYKTMM